MQCRLGVLSALATMALLALPVLAGDTVTATVTPQLILSATLDVTAVNYGTLGTSAGDAYVSRTKATSSTITATNNGNALEDFYIKGTDAITGVGGDSNWTLDCSPLDSDPDGAVGANQYVHRFDLGNSFVSAEALTICHAANQKKIANDLAVSGTQDFVLELSMPTTTTGFSQRSMTVTIVATGP